jgi:4-hydroxyphenylpyruvate dioxygenase-like putative hemolysin
MMAVITRGGNKRFQGSIDCERQSGKKPSLWDANGAGFTVLQFYSFTVSAPFFFEMRLYGKK